MPRPISTSLQPKFRHESNDTGHLHTPSVPTLFLLLPPHNATQCHPTLPSPQPSSPQSTLPLLRTQLTLKSSPPKAIGSFAVSVANDGPEENTTHSSLHSHLSSPVVLNRMDSRQCPHSHHPGGLCEEDGEAGCGLWEEEEGALH